MADNGVEYDDGGFPHAPKRKSSTGLIGFLMRAGFAKDERQANMVLAGTLIVAVVIGVGVWFVR